MKDKQEAIENYPKLVIEFKQKALEWSEEEEKYKKQIEGLENEILKRSHGHEHKQKVL